MTKTYLLTLTCILFFSSLLYAAEEPFVVIDSIKGKAEVQRAGQYKWVLVSRNGKLYNNDIIRILDNSMARLKWQNGSIMYVNTHSQIQINLHKDTANNIFTNYATVFFGAIYFIVKKTLPREVFAREETKVYTPTAILAIRGTAFSVDVNKKNGETLVNIINGTILVKNILKNQSMFISAGYKTVISMNTDPLVPAALLDSDINLMKAWIPPNDIVEQMAQQLQKAKSDYATLTGKLEEKISVVPLVNNSVYKGAWNISENIAAMLAENITLSSRVKCSVVRPDQAEIDPILLGMKEKSRFVITGEIRRFEIIQRAEITAAADKYSEHSIAAICLVIQLIDIEAKTQLYKNEFCQEVSGKNIEGNNWKYIGKLPFDLKDQAFASSILGKALNQAFEQSTAGLSRYLGIDVPNEPAQKK